MKKLYISSTNFFVSLLVFLGILAGCKKEDNLGTAPRLFRPVVTVSTASGQNWIRATWNDISSADSFAVDLSTDTFKTIYRSVVTDSAAYTFANVDWDQEYQIRVKCSGKDSATSSRYYVSTGYKIIFPTLLIDLTPDDITDVGVRPKWSSNAGDFTSLKVYKMPIDSLVTTVDLTSTDTTNMYKEIYGLKPSTSYKVVAYSGDSYKGRKTFTSHAAQNFAIPVDLRGIDDATASTMITTSYLQGLQNGSTVILKRGMSYQITAQVYIGQSITFVTGLGFGGGPATFSLSSNFNFTAAANMDSVRFEGVNLIGTNPAAGFSGNFGGYYVFNVSTTSSAQNVTLDGCTIKYLRGVCRIQAGGPQISNFTINNCVIDSIAGYGIANIDNVAASMLHITVTNSTITNALYFIRSTRNPTTLTQSIDLENCTFYHITQSPNYFLDISGTTTIVNGVTLKNCIFGPGLPSSGTTPTTNISGYRVANILSFATGGNFQTSDLTWTTGTDLPDVSLYNGASTDLFVAPGSGDFHFKDNSFIGKSTSGDPRWQQ